MTSQLQLSIEANEILSAGVDLEICLPPEVSQNNIHSAITLRRDRRTVITPTNIDQKSFTLRLATKHLEPSPYQLHVNELSDEQGNILIDHQVTPFRIAVFKGKIDPRYRIEKVSHLAFGELEAKRLLPTAEVPSGFKLVEFVKAVDRESGVPKQLAFDGLGNPVDGESFISEFQQRRYRKFGCLDEKLFKHVSEIKPTETVDIAIWPSLDVDLTAYEKPNDGPILEIPNAARQLFEKAMSSNPSFLETLQKLGAQVKTTSLTLPLVHATLKAENVFVLAKSKGIGKVFRDDRSVKPDLSDSLAIARAPQAQALGFTGAGVRVAVFENGPSDTTDLSFEDRYLSSPANNQHSRLTSGIIKNIETGKPHGYAPDCLLYSANSGDNAALTWALEKPRVCTVISQSFHREEEQTNDHLSSDDILKDQLAAQYPFPTIVHAAGNIVKKDGDTVDEFVNHKGFNTISVASHDETASMIATSSVFNNPTSTHGDRELPEISANGTTVTAVGYSDSGTSFAAPAVAGTVALIQSVDGTLKSWPEGCRAILFAGANRNISGGTWYADVISRVDQQDGAGALNANQSVRIARSRLRRNNTGSRSAWDVGTLVASDIGVSRRFSKFRYQIKVPFPTLPIPRTRYTVKVALAWNSKVAMTFDFGIFQGGILDSKLTIDLDLIVQNSKGVIVANSASNDNSYEIVEFEGTPGETYDVFIRHWSGELSYMWYGIAWNVTWRPLFFPLPPIGGSSP